MYAHTVFWCYVQYLLKLATCPQGNTTGDMLVATEANVTCFLEKCCTIFSNYFVTL